MYYWAPFSAVYLCLGQQVLPSEVQHYIKLIFINAQYKYTVYKIIVCIYLRSLSVKIADETVR